MKFALLAFKNLSRHRRRSLLTGSIMVFSVAAIILAMSLGEAFYRQLVDVGIRTTTGHLQVFANGWDFDIINPINGEIPEIHADRELRAIIAETPHFYAQGREIIYQTMFFDRTDRFFYGTIIGVEPLKISETLSGLQLKKGTEIAAGVRDGIMISPAMQRFFKPQIDEPMYIVTGGPNGMLDGIKSTFKGVVESMPLFASRVAFSDLAKVQSLLRWAPEACSNIKIMLADKDYAEESAVWLQKRLTAAGLPLTVKTWKELGGFFYHIAQLGRMLTSILVFLLAAITAISVSNTMLMSTRERTREIGTMMAQGLKGMGVVRIFLLESFYLSLVSAGAGAALGTAITIAYRHRGLIEGLTLVLEGRLFPILDVFTVTLSFAWILAIGTLGGVYPAVKASRVQPIIALRHT